MSSAVPNVKNNEEPLDIDIDTGETDSNEYYDWEMIPKRNSEETKTGVTFKGDSDEYISAHRKILEMMNKKGVIYFVNGRRVKIWIIQKISLLRLK